MRCVAASVLGWSALAARGQRVRTREELVFRWFNDAPDRLEAPAWAVMQAGSLGGVFVVGAFVRLTSNARQAIGVIGVGTTVWLAMKAVKPLIGRGRPDDLLDDVTLRGRPQTGLGFPSGHAAVATVLALTSTASPRSRLAALSVAAVAGTSRMYVGAHLPLDVVGGYAAGALAGSAAAGVLSSNRGAGAS